MLKLYLCSQRPALTEVVAEVQTEVGQIEAPVTGVVGITLGSFVTVKTLTVKIAGHDGLTVTAYMKT